MKRFQNVAGLVFWLALSLVAARSEPQRAVAPSVTNYLVSGVIQSIESGGKSLVVSHEEVTNYMPAMTMPFTVRTSNELAGLRAGDRITFQLLVTAENSWIERIIRIGRTNLNAVGRAAPPAFALTNIPNFFFTNEFGRPASLRDFPGQAVAFTFFFTRCPVPEYCPRLIKNFSTASQTINAMPGGPTNWHLFSLSFDPADTPPVLLDYARRYNYDSNHWSFLTGPADQMAELAHGFGVKISGAPGSYTHGFATVVFDAGGRLQARWPIGGDTSGGLVQELMKGATNH